MGFQRRCPSRMGLTGHRDFRHRDLQRLRTNRLGRQHHISRSPGVFGFCRMLLPGAAHPAIRSPRAESGRTLAARAPRPRPVVGAVASQRLRTKRHRCLQVLLDVVVRGYSSRDKVSTGGVRLDGSVCSGSKEGSLPLPMTSRATCSIVAVGRCFGSLSKHFMTSICTAFLPMRSTVDTRVSTRGSSRVYTWQSKTPNAKISPFLGSAPSS
mmetsp:Transcript_13164/g.29260  ORF Transcript_13164/g.29260 Transcript_13164/m.29260 type:complete len:211 (-) Transcript_13164:715-1347(-)